MKAQIVQLQTTDFVRHPNELRAAVERIPTALTTLGLSIHPSSRFARHADVARMALGIAEFKAASPNEVRPMQQAISELSMLDFALQKLAGQTQWKSKFRDCLSGSTLPWDDRNGCARNTEFELYVAAILSAAGFHTSVAEPDVTIVVDGWRIGFAAKRLQSRKAVVRRVGEGMEQITRSGHAGFVVIDISVNVFERDQFIETNDLALAQSMLNDMIYETAGEVGESLLERSNPQIHLGVLYIALVPVILRASTPAVFCPLMHRAWSMWARPSARQRVNKLIAMSHAVAAVPTF